MPSNKLAEAFTNAQHVRDLCQTTQSIHAYQRISILAVEVCASATPDARKKASALAAHATKKTDALITNRAGLALSSEGKKALEEFESTLELIRRHIESIPERGSKPSKVKFGISALTFRHESARLKAQLDRVYQSLTSKARTRARNEYILEVATLGTRITGTLCEISLPGLNFLKPVVGLAVLICDTAKTVNGNRTAAVALASHAQEVTHSIVERAEKEPHGNNNAASVDNLRLTLEEIQAFLERLKSRRRTTAWLMAVKDKDRFVELNGALDRALAVFCGSQSIAMTASVRESAQELATIAATVNRVEEGVTRTIPASVQENTQQLATVVATVNCVEESVTRAITASVQGNRQQLATLVAAVNQGVTRAITASVQGNRQELATLVATANRVEEGVKRMITLVDTARDLGGNTQLYSFRSNFNPSISNLTFFFYYLGVEGVEC